MEGNPNWGGREDMQHLPVGTWGGEAELCPSKARDQVKTPGWGESGNYRRERGGTGTQKEAVNQEEVEWRRVKIRERQRTTLTERPRRRDRESQRHREKETSAGATERRDNGEAATERGKHM